MARDPRVNFDLFIALAALLISTIAALASVYQTRIFATQLSATIWPYLSVRMDYPGDGSADVRLVNDGMGPALVRAASAKFDGKRIASWNDVLVRFQNDTERQHLNGHFSATSVDEATIVRAGESIRLLSLRGSRPNTIVGDELKRLDLAFCYCSIQNRCWSISSETKGPPADTLSCPQNQSIAASPIKEQ